MGDYAKPGPLSTRLSRRRSADGQNPGEGGFTLIEVVIAISLLMIMMIPFADSYITSLSVSNAAHSREVAAMLSDTALDQAKAINATKLGYTTLLYGRMQAAVTTEWAAPAPGLSTTSGILADTSDNQMWDTVSTDTPAALPTTPQSETVGSQTFKVYYYVGTCWAPAYDSGGQNSNTCTNPATWPTTGYTMYRVIADVTWTAPHGGCGLSGCYYISSLLIDGTVPDPAFDLNPTIPYMTSSTSTTFIAGTAGSFQVTSSGFPPPSFTDASYGAGACTASTLPNGVTLSTTGLLSGTPINNGSASPVGTYTVCINATNADGTGTQQFILTVSKASPSLSTAAPSSVTVGSQIVASTITATLAGGYAETAGVTFTRFGPQASAPTTCTAGGTSMGTDATSPYNPPNSATFTPTVGNYWIYASYPGDSDNNAAASICGPGMTEIQVAPASPTLTVAAPSTGLTGTPIVAGTISATLASGDAPTGTITYSVYGPGAAPTTCTSTGNAGTANVTLGNHAYSPSSAVFTPTAPGFYWWYASYGGDANDNSATTACPPTAETLVTGKYVTALTVTGPATGTIGTPVSAGTISATLAGGDTSPNAQGSITYSVFGPSATAPTTCTSTGNAGTQTINGNGAYSPSTNAFTPTAAGDYWWYASYAGDTDDNATTTACPSLSEMVVPVKVAQTASNNGSGTTISATLGSAPPSGSTLLIYFYAEDSTTHVPTVAITGVTPLSATVITSVAPTGSNNVLWAYRATATGLSSTVTVTFTNTGGNLETWSHIDVLSLTGNSTTPTIAQFQNTSGTSANPTATLPTTPAPGDLEVAFNGAAGNDGGALATPTNWTKTSATSSVNGAGYGVSSYYTTTGTSTSQTFPWTTSVAWTSIAVDVNA